MRRRALGNVNNEEGGYNPIYPYGENIGDYYAWSLRRHYDWDKGFLEVTRVSDGETRFLHFDPSEYIITLNTITSTSVDAKMGTSTLGVWASGTNVWINRIFAQNSTGMTLSNHYLYVSLATSSNTAYLILSGALIYDSDTGTHPIMDFSINGNCDYKLNSGSINSFVGGSNSSTMICIALNPTDENVNRVWNTSSSASPSDALHQRIDTRSLPDPDLGGIRVDGTNYNVDLDTKIEENTIQRNILIKTGAVVKGSSNSEILSETAWSGTFSATFGVHLGYAFGNYFDGEFFELAITDQDEDVAGNWTEIHENLETYFV